MWSAFVKRVGMLAVGYGLCSASVFAIETTYGVTDEEGFFNGATYYEFFGRYAPLPEEASSVGSRASDFVSRQGYIRDGEDRVQVSEQDPMPGDDDFSGEFTTSPGVTVGMSAHVGPLSPALPNPVRARTDFFANHVEATTSRGYYFYGVGTSGEPDSDGIGDNDFWLRTFGQGAASSFWGDTWTATATMNHSVLFALDGTIALNDPCPNATCGIIYPGGTEAVRSLPWIYELDAVMAIFDLKDIRPCEALSNECDGESSAPVGVASVKVSSAGSANSGSSNQDAAILKNGGTLSVDITGQLDFEAKAGHEYYILAQVKVRSESGVTLDFFNTFGLTGVVDPTGNLSSDAVANKGAALPSAVPVPGAVWLMLGGLPILARRMRRR